MRSYVGHQEVWSEDEFEELAYGLDRELFLGSPDETDQERAARLDAARGVLDDLREQGLGGDEVAAWDALYAEALSHTVPLLRSATGRGVRGGWAGDAA